MCWRLLENRCWSCAGMSRLKWFVLELGTIEQPGFLFRCCSRVTLYFDCCMLFQRRLTALVKSTISSLMLAYEIQISKFKGACELKRFLILTDTLNKNYFTSTKFKRSSLKISLGTKYWENSLVFGRWKPAPSSEDEIIFWNASHHFLDYIYNLKFFQIINILLISVITFWKVINPLLSTQSQKNIYKKYAVFIFLNQKTNKM